MSKKFAYWLAPLAIAAGITVAGRFANAQEASKAVSPPPAETQAKVDSIYRLDYVVRELEDGKRINSRNYSLSARTQEWASIRVGSRVPIGTSGSQGPGGVQYSGMQYQDVGIDIDSRPVEHDHDFMLGTRFESSSVVTPDKPADERDNPYLKAPVIRRVRFDGYSLVPLGKPTVIATLDDVATNRRYEIEVTVTKVK